VEVLDEPCQGIDFVRDAHRHALRHLGWGLANDGVAEDFEGSQWGAQLVRDAHNHVTASSFELINLRHIADKDHHHDVVIGQNHRARDDTHRA
jgi:hypothetical protein